MGYFFDTFYFEPGSRMTGIWDSGIHADVEQPLVALASLVRLGQDQHDVVESDFLSAHMPFRFAGFHGAGPDGHPFMMMLQVAPASAASLVGSNSVYWPMTDGLDRALHYNWEAELIEDRGFTRDQLIDIYTDRGIQASAIADWSVPDLMLGLLAECCYVPLPQIVAGRITQCAFPDLQHDCRREVFADVFSVWMSGALNPAEPDLDWDDEDPEPPDDIPARKLAARRPRQHSWPKSELREMSTKKLRKLALKGYWDEDEISELKRKQLVTLLSTPHWRNRLRG